MTLVMPDLPHSPYTVTRGKSYLWRAQADVPLRPGLERKIMQDENENDKPTARRSYWEVFMDDIHLLFLLGAVIMVLLYTIWGLVELASVPTHPMINL